MKLRLLNNSAGEKITRVKHASVMFADSRARLIEECVNVSDDIISDIRGYTYSHLQREISICENLRPHNSRHYWQKLYIVTTCDAINKYAQSILPREHYL